MQEKRRKDEKNLILSQKYCWKLLTVTESFRLFSSFRLPSSKYAFLEQSKRVVFYTTAIHLIEKFIELKKQGGKPLVGKKRAEEVVIFVLIFLLILVLMLLEQ